MSLDVTTNAAWSWLKASMMHSSQTSSSTIRSIDLGCGAESGPNTSDRRYRCDTSMCCRWVFIRLTSEPARYASKGSSRPSLTGRPKVGNSATCSINVESTSSGPFFPPTLIQMTPRYRSSYVDGIALPPENISARS